MAVPLESAGSDTRVGFSTPKSFNPVSWLVRKATGSRASHAFFVYYDARFELEMVMEAHEVGIRLTPLKRFARRNNVLAQVRPRHPIDAGMKVIARRYLGSMYDWAGLVGMAVVLFGRFLRRKWRNPFRGSKSVYCSEAVVLAMKHSVGYEKLGLDTDSSPQDLYDYFVGEEQGQPGGDAAR